MHFPFGYTCIIAWITVALLHISDGSFCNVETEYQCSNKKCIPLSLTNNSVNDCGDNSDEVSFPCRAPLFSCKINRCVLQDWVLDGVDDCTDASDEAKVIGTNCTSAKNCCFCEDFVPNSECRDSICQCRRGFYRNLLGTYCTRRQIGSRCLNDADCSAAVDHSRCSEFGRCTCLDGFRKTNDSKSCTKRDYGDGCSVDRDCAAIPNSVCRKSQCQCRSGYKTVTSSFSDATNLYTDYPISSSVTTLPGATTSDSVKNFSSSTPSSATSSKSVIISSDSISSKAFTTLPPFTSSGTTSTVLRYKRNVCRMNRKYNNGVKQSSESSRTQNSAQSHLENIHIVLKHRHARSISNGDTPPLSTPTKITTITLCVAPVVGDFCSTDGDCSGLRGSICSSAGSCTCAIGHKEDGNGTRCLPLRVGDSCSADADCTNGVSAYTHCNQTTKLCECLAGYSLLSQSGECANERRHLNPVLVGCLLLVAVLLAIFSATITVYMVWKFLLRSRGRLEITPASNNIPKASKTNGYNSLNNNVVT